MTNADRQTVRRLCLDLLLRTPTPAEVRSYVGAPVAKIVARLLDLRETYTVWVEEELLFFLLLDNFRPMTRAIRSLPERMHRGEISAHGAIREIMMSTGFSLRNPGNDTFVTVVLEQGIGMRVQDRKNRKVLAAGKKMYDGYPVKLLGKKGKTQADVVKIVLGQERFTELLLDRYHRRLMRKPLPKDKATKAQVARVHADPHQFFKVLGEWLSSAAYRESMQVKRQRSDNQFIRGLYMDLLGRPPAYQEFRNMRNALLSMADPTPLRAVMARVMLGSKEARLPQYRKGKEAAFVQTCFLRYLGRKPTQTEAAKFAKALLAPEVEPSHIVRCLVTCPEYQYY